jgi:hypothetical protein
MPSDTVMLVGTLIPILAVVFVGLLLLVPVAGLTLRFALKPAVEAFARMKELQGQGQELRLLEARLTLLEEKINSAAFTRMLDENEFRRELEEGRDAAARQP